MRAFIKNGVMAGLLFFEDRNGGGKPKHVILSNFARVLLGTVYLPRGVLTIDADQPIADQSAYTAIIAYGIELKSGPHLVLNTNYNETDVPVPDGIGNGNNWVVLAK